MTNKPRRFSSGVVKGYVSISAKHSAGPEATAGSPTGPFGHVVMADNSKITLEKDAALYAWGYIQGSGAVTVENGGAVYECFQIMDWRGGDNTSGMIGNEQRVSPCPSTTFRISKCP